MKSLRLCLLLLLIVLLPIRGAFAAGLLCPADGSGVQAETQRTAHAHLHAMGHELQQHALCSHDKPGEHDHAGAHDHGGGVDKCNLCSACCSVAGLVSADVAVPVPQPVPVVFPHLYAPRLSFVSEGQERPPRST